jgi:hypothetical protein
MNIAARSSWERYLPDRDPTHQLGIRARSWQEYELLNPSGSIIERSMLMLNEIALLYMLARDYYSGDGEIVDLGPLLGVGTNALARGLADSSRRMNKDRRIHSFDLFLAKGMGEVVAESPRSGSVFDRFLRNNADYIRHISVSPGNLLDMSWDSSPVEILFVDIAKSWELNAAVVQRFFKRLIPGKSVVVQQDYVHFFEYWIPITMEVFSDYFEPLYFLTGATSVYRCRREIPNSLLYSDIERLPIEEKLAYLERAQTKAPASAREILKCAQAYCLVDHGEGERALELLKSVRFSVPPASEPTEDFNPMIGSNAKAVDDVLRAKLGRGALGLENPGAGLKADLRVVLDRADVSDREKLKAKVHVRNIGQSGWTFGPASSGVVNLGAHLLDAIGEIVIEQDYLRRRIGPASLLSLAPGEEVAFDVELPAPTYGRYVLEFDLVSEMVCWFEQNGSKTVRIPIRVC